MTRPITDALCQVMKMTSDIVDRIDRGESAASLIIDRDRLLMVLTPDEHKLFAAWSAQGMPS